MQAFQRLTLLFFLLLTSQFESMASSAAENDWVRQNTGDVCHGQYVEPAAGGPAAGGPAAGGPAAGSSLEEQVNASADAAQHQNNQSTTLTGDVVISQGNQTIHADSVSFDATTETYQASGGIKYRQPGLLIKGEAAAGNIFLGTSVVDSASFLLHANRLRGSAQQLAKNADGNLVIRDGAFTTCEPDDNTWTLLGKSVDLHIAEGYGEARHVRLHVLDQPIAYFPYLRFPIDDSRQSGFLLPAAGHDSDGGTDIAIPYYFNLAPNFDATYSLRSIWKRGVMHEGEFRFKDEYGRNLIAATYLPSDDKYDNGSGDEDRWLTHLVHQGSRGPWSSQINFTSVSDTDYIEDLGGFTTTDSGFDRAMDRVDSPALVRTGSVTYRQAYWSSRLDLRSFQTQSRNQPGQYEVLPRLTLAAHRRFGIAETEARLQATEFDKSGDDSPKGTRVVLDARVALPLQRSWGFIKPAVRVVHRDYSLDDADPISRSLTTTLASIDSGLVFEKPQQLFSRDVIQTLEPRLHYLYVEEDFQDDLPNFDTALITPDFNALFRDNRFSGYDRFADANRFALGLTTRYLAREDGTELLSISVGQMFHLEDRKLLPEYGNAVGDRNTSPLFASLRFNLGAFQFGGFYELDTEENRSNRGYLSIRYRAANRATFHINYALTDESQQNATVRRGEEESDLSFYWPLTDNGEWRVIGRWNYGWDRGETIESLFGLEYNDCCWKTRIVFRRQLEEPRFVTLAQQEFQQRLDRRADSGIYFEFQLKGLGSLGGRMDAMLRDAIPGFQPDL